MRRGAPRRAGAVLLVRDVDRDRRRAELAGGRSRRSTFRAASVSPYPSSRSMRAIARPIPDEPPVTSALGTRRSSHRRRPPGSGGLRGARERGRGRSSRRPTCTRPGCRTPSLHSRGDAADADEPREGRRVRGEVLGRAARGAARRHRPRGRRGPARRARPRRRRGRVPPRRADGARLHRRLLPARRRRSAHVRTDRRDERAQRRLRDGRQAAARALGDRVPRGAARSRCSARCWPGAAEATREAGAILAGGHTIRDDEPKYGLAVVGTVHPDGVWRKSGARPGDAVLLTKPLGTGLVLQARARRACAGGRARRGGRGDDRARTATPRTRCVRSRRTR